MPRAGPIDPAPKTCASVLNSQRPVLTWGDSAIEGGCNIRRVFLGIVALASAPLRNVGARGAADDVGGLLHSKGKNTCCIRTHVGNCPMLAHRHGNALTCINAFVVRLVSQKKFECRPARTNI